MTGPAASAWGTIPHGAGGGPREPAEPEAADLRARLIDEATYELERHEPQFSARSVVSRGQIKAFYVLLAIAIPALALAPAWGAMILTGLVALGYLANVIFRVWLFWMAADPRPQPSSAVKSSTSPQELPLYSVIVPLYREANVVPQLAEALAALDYPRARLEVALAVEEDDAETCDAAAREAAARNFTVLRVPRGAPRTKPRACNYALRFCQGEFLVIYDAEDRPEPDQLRKAVVAFRASAPAVACLQARLNFFNARENWITRGIMAQTPQEFRPVAA